MSHATDAAAPRYRGTRPLRLVTTTAEGGQRTTTLPYLPDEERQLLIAVDTPAWYADLRDRPRVTVEQGSLRYPADAVVVDDAERDRVLARAVEADHAWRGVVADRPVAVVALTPVVDAPPDRLGDHLIRVHDASVLSWRRCARTSSRPAAGWWRSCGSTV